ncbi:MAG: Rpn family recombination-promoting nuclease/putative transposase [Coleofasciculaceae cyanobacterium SM2_1_6]|nr:Rpn family recombination-promoting nuclease/putative transposase [Coleofasciculaceae cyanobacterium SM2_1_6]
MYDNSRKRLAETFPADFASWLLGEPMPFTALQPSELSSEPIRADSLIFLESSAIILHLEFQTSPDENMPLRMLDYWVRIRRRFPTREIHQTVIYLKPTNSDLVFQNSFTSTETNHKFQIIRMWEQLPQSLQQYQGLLPFVTLCQTDNPEELLRQVAQQIEGIDDKKVQADLITAAYVISGLTLKEEIVKRILRQEIMQESSTYQGILRDGKAAGLAEGLAEGLARGKAETARQIALNMLRSGISVDLISQFTGLTLEQIQALQ